MPTRTARNAPCPCGSGRKHKLCCGTTREEERELERRAEALEALLTLPALFPLMRPESRAFRRWAEEVSGRPDWLTRDLLEDGLRRMGRRERMRIATEYRKQYPSIWDELCAQLGDARIAERALLVGAVTAALSEARVEPKVLDLLEELDGSRADPAEALAMVLDPCDLWSPVEAMLLDDALAEIPDDELDDDRLDQVAAGEARRLFTTRHERRLRRLVARIREQLPSPGHPQVSDVLLEACGRLDRERGFRLRVAALVLTESLGRLRPAAPQDWMRQAA